MQDFLDIVSSKGAYLVARPNTPIHIPRTLDDEIEKFATALTSGLDGLLRKQEIRRRKYGDAAFESLPQHTPSELVEKHEKELERLYVLMDAPSPPSECGGSDEMDRKANLERKEIERILHKPRSASRLEQPPATHLPTLLPSNVESSPNSFSSNHESLWPTSENVVPEAKRGKKQQLDDIEEEGHHRKNQKIAAEADCQCLLPDSDNTMSEAATMQRKKRRRSGTEVQKSQPKNKKSWMIVKGPRQPHHSARLRQSTGLAIQEA